MRKFDPYTGQYKTGVLWWGNRNPIQQLKRWYVKRFLLKGKRLRRLSLEQPGE